MKAVQITELGGPEVLRLVELADPEPPAGTVLIRVESAAVNFSDVMRRRGDAYPVPTALPFVPGGEVAGTVVALGPGVEGPPVGTPVFAIVGADGSGGYAELAVAGEAGVIPIPPGVDVDAAAGVLIAGGGAMVMLSQSARLSKHESVFVPAAAGGAGGFAVQIAKLLGAGPVIAGASTPAKREAALGLGADHAVDYSRPGWVEEVRALTGGTGVDVALEMSGGGRLGQTLQTLGPFGRAVVYGSVSGRHGRIPDDVLDAMLYDPSPNQSLIGFNLGPWFALRPEVAFAALTQLVGWVATGEVTVPVGRSLPLAEAAEAHRLLESGATTGKLVLKP